jgi:hypothetical protein
VLVLAVRRGMLRDGAVLDVAGRCGAWAARRDGAMQNSAMGCDACRSSLGAGTLVFKLRARPFGPAGAVNTALEGKQERCRKA